jgi:hypothetical protein
MVVVVAMMVVMMMVVMEKYECRAIGHLLRRSSFVI